MVVDGDELVDVTDRVVQRTDGWVLEATISILTAVVEHTSLLVDVLDVQRLQLSTTAELYVLQSLDVYNQSIRLSLSDRLLEFQVGDLYLVSEADNRTYHRLGDHPTDVGSHSAVAHLRTGKVVYVLRDVLLQAVVKDVLGAKDELTSV